MLSRTFLSWSILIMILFFYISKDIFAQSESGFYPSDPSYISSLPVLTITSASSALQLPDEHDNSTSVYFPNSDGGGVYIYEQEGTSSCQSVSSIFYCFTFEINRLRGISSNTQNNRYAPNYSWNHLNEGYCGWQGYTSLSAVHGFLKQAGAMSDYDFDGNATLSQLDCTRWPSGYEKYFSTITNKLESVKSVAILKDGSGLDNLKHYLYDHGTGAAVGGLITFGARDFGQSLQELPSTSSYAGEFVRTTMVYDGGSGHSVAIVGYCDDVEFDWGGAMNTLGEIIPDGQIRNDKDNNFDGEINMADWEIGAIKIANSYGSDHGNLGFEWVLYCCLPHDPPPGETGTINEFYILFPKETYDPGVVLKLKVDHTKRNDISFGCGYALNANASTYEDYYDHWGYKFDGGDNVIQGKTISGTNIQGPIDILLDFDYFFLSEDYGKVFLVTHNNGSIPGNIEYYALVDYRWGEEFELAYGQTNFAIANGGVYGINYDLIPHEQEMSSNITLNSDMVSRFNPTVNNGATLTVDEDVQIDMYESELEIMSTSTLTIGDGAIFFAKDGICKITVDGDINIGVGVQFKAEEGAQLEIRLNKTNQTITVDGANFERAALISYIDDLTVKNSTFTDGGIYAFNGDVELDNTDFQNSWAHCSSADYGDSRITVTGGCTFNNVNTYALKIDDYPEFLVENSTFSNNQYGIYVLYSGDGRFVGEIDNCILTNHSEAGIQIYNSDVNITSNNIIQNDYGIKSLNNSSVGLTGTNTNPPTQYISDNTYYEVYASSGAFPHHFKWNEIVDNDNTEPIIYYSGPLTLGLTLDVSNNYWGGAYFHPSGDLYPYSYYTWLPFWDPYSKSTSVAESLYDGALDKIYEEDFAGAKSDLKELIEEHSSTVYAQAAVKKLFSMEAYSGEDYIGLKTYLEEEVSLEDGAELEKLRDFLITFCEIKQENWETAITWFEDVILDPETMEDSIFSIIDLGYTYLLMEEGGYKSAYTGAMLEHVPTSIEAYEEKREYLLSLIPGKQMSEEMQKDIQNLENGELLHNVPNPFSSSTQIWYKLDTESEVTIRVFDYTGKEVRTYPVGRQPQGHHHVDFITDHLPSGVYFFNLEVNSLVTDTKKMTLIK